jgi:subtilisin family serine protease
MAPGMNIRSTYPNGQFTIVSGTSFATLFVTGTIALLWSLFPNVTAAEIMNAITRRTFFNRRRSIIPTILNAEAALNILKNF